MLASQVQNRYTLGMRAQMKYLLLGFLLPAALFGQEAKDLGYALGWRQGQYLKSKGMDVDADAYAQAMKDALSGAKPRVPEETMDKTLSAFLREQQDKLSLLAQENEKKGQAFLAENSRKPGVMKLASGLQYEVLKNGDGPKPQPQDLVKVHYRGTLVSGKEFDSSYSRGEPATFRISQVIPGWQEVLPLMPQGSKWRVVVPPKLAYGSEGAGSIGPNEVLIFEIELLAVHSS